MISVTVYSTRYDVDVTLDSLEALFGREEDSLSISKQSSEVYRINHRTDSVVTVNGTVRRILAICKTEYARSGGLFDVTVEPLKTLYGLESHQKEAYHVPASQELYAALANIGFSRIRFVSDSVLVIPAGMHIDFGGVGKGFVLTQAGKFLHAHNIHCFLVNGGGDLITSGIKPSGDRWNIGVQDPRNPEKLSATLACSTGCVFTSGDYERCFFEKGVRYHHLFDPRTGMPGRLNMSATVIGTIPVEVDAIVKTAFLMPPRDALAYLASRGLQGYLIDSSKVGWASNGLKGWLKPDSGCVVHFE
jgi:thiamine biosynthesis lipoprotein